MQCERIRITSEHDTWFLHRHYASSCHICLWSEMKCAQIISISFAPKWFHSIRIVLWGTHMKNFQISPSLLYIMVLLKIFRYIFVFKTLCSYLCECVYASRAASQHQPTNKMQLEKQITRNMHIFIHWIHTHTDCIRTSTTYFKNSLFLFFSK